MRWELLEWCTSPCFTQYCELLLFTSKWPPLGAFLLDSQAIPIPSTVLSLKSSNFGFVFFYGYVFWVCVFAFVQHGFSCLCRLFFILMSSLRVFLPSLMLLVGETFTLSKYYWKTNLHFNFLAYLFYVCKFSIRMPFCLRFLSSLQFHCNRIKVVTKCKPVYLMFACLYNPPIIGFIWRFSNTYCR